MADNKTQTTETTTETTTATETTKVAKKKEEALEMEGKVVEALKGKFKVEIPSPTPEGKPLYVLAHIAGKLRHNFIKIVQGDRVKVEVSPYDLTRGRITFRLK